jgi:hypothetical protein
VRHMTTGYKVEKLSTVVARDGSVVCVGGWYVTKPVKRTKDADGIWCTEFEVITGPHDTKADAMRAVGWKP